VTFGESRCVRAAAVGVGADDAWNGCRRNAWREVVAHTAGDLANTRTEERGHGLPPHGRWTPERWRSVRIVCGSECGRHDTIENETVCCGVLQGC
jgi:hypothetical protein